MIRLTATSLKTWRNAKILEQGGRCALCGLPFGSNPPLDPVGDHDHRTGAMRSVLHRGCNSLYGVIENNAPRYGVRSIAVFANGVGQYQRAHMVNITGCLHPTYRTEEEKRVRRNAKARATRAKKRNTDETS